MVSLRILPKWGLPSTTLTKPGQKLPKQQSDHQTSSYKKPNHVPETLAAKAEYWNSIAIFYLKRYTQVCNTNSEYKTRIRRQYQMVKICTK